MKLQSPLLLFVIFLSFFASTVWAQNFIHVNQLGYYPYSPKKALLTDLDADSYTLRVASSNRVVYSGRLEKERMWSLSGENIQIADFSEYNTPGRYYLQVGSERSYPFQISNEGVYDEVSQWTIKAFYLWRASCAIDSAYADFKGVNYARKAGHPDTVVYIHPAVANEKRRVESEVSAPRV